MKEIMLGLKCGCCGFWEQHTIYTNEYGYFVFPNAYCPECLCLLNVSAEGSIKNITEADKT